MTVFTAEFRKLLNPRLLLIAAALSALYGYVFLAPQLESLTADHPQLETHQIEVRAAHEFGTEISPAEFSRWQREYQQIEATADARIAADPALAALHVTTWAQLIKEQNGTDDARAHQLFVAADPIFFRVAPGHAGLGYTLEAFSDLLDRYQAIEQHGATALSHDTPAITAQSRATVASGSWRAVQSGGLLEVVATCTLSLAILVVLVVLLVVAPAPLTDTVRRMRPLQYASKAGRRVFTAQLAATLLAAAAAGLIACVVAAIAFSTSQIAPFLGNSLGSFASGLTYRTDENLAVALAVSAAIVVLLAVATGAAAFALARWSNNYIGLLVRLVIAFAALATLTSNILADPLTFANPVWQLVAIPNVEILTAVVLALLTLGAAVLVARRELTHDVA